MFIRAVVKKTIAFFYLFKSLFDFSDYLFIKENYLFFSFKKCILYIVIIK